jgi:mannitol/fructose-specific phosphotransferase system IIA component (Ntr-type)
LRSAALEAKDPNSLLKIVQELSQVLKREQVRRDFREAMRMHKASA